MSAPDIHFKSIFVSDFHLGSADCDAIALGEFLKCIRCDKLYLVGDIVDFWVGKKRGQWERPHTDVIRHIFNLTHKGTEVYLTPGNHDSELRRLNGIDFSGIRIEHEFVHEAADGKRYLVVHGDFFDRSVTTFRSLAVVAAWIHELMAKSNQMVNHFRVKAGKPPSDFSGRTKTKFKRMVSYFTNFPDRITVDAKNQKFDGVICGHIHRPEMLLHESGAYYINCGDWMNHNSMVVEHDDGRLELLYWSDLMANCLCKEEG